MTNTRKNNILFKSTMQTIDIRKLNALRRYSGDLCFDVEAPSELIGIPFVEFVGKVKAELHYDILEDDSVEVTGKVTYRLKGLCSRCLNETEHTFVGEVDAYFVKGLPKDDEYVYDRGVIDLTECVNDAIMFSVPSNFVCGDSCIPLEWHEK